MGVDVRLIKRRGEQKIWGESKYGWTCYPFYYHSRGVSQRKVYASRYFMRGDKNKRQQA